MEMFRARAAQSLRDAHAAGISDTACIARLAAEQQAFVAALADTDFLGVMRTAFLAAWQQQLPAAAYQIPPERAEEQLKGVLANRRRDAQQYLQALNDPQFIADLRRMSARAPDRALPDYEIPSEKREDVVRRLVQPHDPAGAEPLIHIEANILGQRLVHQVLADLFRPAGPLRVPLVAALGKYWPGADAGQRDQAAASWLKARHDPAHELAKALAHGAPLYNAAMQQARTALLLPATPATAAISADQPLRDSTALTPAAREAMKTRQQQAEDLIYTLNHAVTCLSITDTVGIGAAATVVKWITGSTPAWAEHDHGHDHAHGDHAHHDHPAGLRGWMQEKLEYWRNFNLKDAWTEAKSWIIGEAVGDLGAVPFTLAVQRLFPSFMQGIRQLAEPVIGGTFKRNAMRSAVDWGASHGLAADAPEVQRYGHELYEYELSHIGQMATWTVSSVGLNYATMQVMNKLAPASYAHVSLRNFMAGKSIGAGITAGLVLGVRGLSPRYAHAWDQTVGKHVVVPVTKTIGRIFGVRDEDIEAYQKRHGDGAPTPAPDHRVHATQHQAALVTPAATPGLPG